MSTASQPAPKKGLFGRKKKPKDPNKPGWFKQLRQVVSMTRKADPASMWWMLLAALAGSALGFLRHNFTPAKITMGDSGAYMIGYILAAVSVLGALKVTAAVTVVAPILVLALPVVNITQVTLRRLRRGASPVLASNDHLHDMIRIRSGSKNVTVLLLWFATLVLGVLGMLLSATPPLLMYTTVVSAVTLIAFVVLLRLREVRAEQRLAALSE